MSKISSFFLDDDGELNQRTLGGKIGNIRWVCNYFKRDPLAELTFIDELNNPNVLFASIIASHYKGTYQYYFIRNDEVSRADFFEIIKQEQPDIFEWLIWNFQ